MTVEFSVNTSVKVFNPSSSVSFSQNEKNSLTDEKVI